MSSATQSGPKRRPRDRKQQIVTAAGGLFHQHGYGNVSTSDIAAAVGISPGALYRHFRGKQEILQQAIDLVVEDTVTTDLLACRDLTSLVETLASGVRPHRALAVLLYREARHLDHAAGAAVQARLSEFAGRIARHLQAQRPELDEPDAGLLAWLILSTLTSSAYHSAELSPDQEARMQTQCALAVATASMPGSGIAEDDGDAATGLPHKSRREAIVAAAVRLFFEQGYQATTMDDVGAAVGVTGAAVYKYFPSKSELLGATIARAAEPLSLGLARSLAATEDAGEALDLVLDAYIEFATIHRHLVGILVSEVTNLPSVLRRDVRRQQVDYIAEWVRLLRTSRPGISAAQARYVVQAVLTMINDATRIDELRRHRELDTTLRTIGRRLLAADI
ncbi:TetR/AcrR family transcriptional regulator [Nocardioides daejeonensis]|uniref:TetR/AcrR family transcriptional regulator n=1 Tax=Nocardioides daejeonensis TaxID=1046556 RepID=UPI000D75084F|nr:TetR/AcrR family transcriptional regulator [Nocardioides daejeonensis]